MGELGALFNPGMRHELEERRSRESRREEEGNARDGDLRIDLDSGVAVINAPDEDTGPTDESDSNAAPAAHGASSSAAGGGPDPAGRTDVDAEAQADTEAGGQADTEAGGQADTDAGGQADGGDAERPAGPASGPEEAPPPALRPRGKRGLAASRR